jgi:UDP-N-acetylmuramoylalanine-D-glutamate ligase
MILVRGGETVVMSPSIEIDHGSSAAVVATGISIESDVMTVAVTKMFITGTRQIDLVDTTTAGTGHGIDSAIRR